MPFFGNRGGLNVKFLFCNPEKAHPCAEPRLNYFAWKSVQGLGCGPLEEPGKKKPSKHFWCAISCIRGMETPWVIVTKFCMLVDIRDIIMYATFGDDRLRGFGVARGRISHFASSPLHHSRTTVCVWCVVQFVSDSWVSCLTWWSYYNKFQVGLCHIKPLLM